LSGSIRINGCGRIAGGKSIDRGELSKVKNKIIVRAPNHLGDLLMAQPAVGGLAKMFPEERVWLLLPEWAEVIFGRIENIDMLPMKPEMLHGGSAVLKQRDFIKSANFDTGILLTPSFSSALVFYLSGITNRYGYKGDGRNFLLNHPVDMGDVLTKHRSRQYVFLTEYFTGEKTEFEYPRLIISEEKSKQVDDELNKYNLDSGALLVAIAPQAVAESRRWGSDNYAVLAERLIGENDVNIVLLGTANEFQAGEKIAAGDKNVLNLCGKTDIETAAAILSKARLFVGNDSGLAHLAAAVQTPLVVLSGADRPAETSPLSDKKTVIIRDELECISCVKNICPKKGDAFMRCMKEISVDEVYAAAQAMLNK
jgi:heptosyltransferase II